MTTSNDGTMIDDFAQFDLMREIADSEKKKPWQSGHYAKTLFKKSDFRTLLITMEKSSKMKEHHADGTLSVQVLKGQIRFTAQGKSHELPAGSLVTLGASIKHEVEAAQDSAFLLTISWPTSQALRAMEHRGYGT
ncbi:cupin domain-containing protein [Edaphobacter bradus]|uniref:cupin domain-containing protein n=1 Tax=Edaphobacter bradus TaxID=2259016 RepID=UPI0021E00B7F|nr:cupin domain-containing protein [Edaphobacter bradus]